jgi:hypothetical protein
LAALDDILSFVAVTHFVEKVLEEQCGDLCERAFARCPALTGTEV